MRHYKRFPTGMKLSRLAWVILCAMPGRGACAQEPVREFHSIPYVSSGTPNQELDLILPTPAPAPGTKVPLVIYVHGGGWQMGSFHQIPLRAMAGKGYAVASIGYRFSQTAIYPAQIEDCKAAIRWLRANAERYGIDGSRVGVWGTSAGGHLCALLGTTATEKRFDVGENLKESSGVQCVIDSFGPADLLHWGDPPMTEARDTPDTPLAKLVGGPVHEHQDLARLASPVDFVSKQSAPFLILQGDHDTTVPMQQSQELDTALRQAGVESTLVIIPGGGHGGPGFNDPKILAQMAAFFDRHLRPESASH